jgi:hypothetical protein
MHCTGMEAPTIMLTVSGWAVLQLLCSVRRWGRVTLSVRGCERAESREHQWYENDNSVFSRPFGGNPEQC